MKIQNAYYLLSSFKEKDFPDLPHPEFAFLGRSNVGKSSLLNMLTGQKNLCRVGQKPGVTKAVNFFIINENITFADLPGFGYAKLPKGVKEKFYPLIKNYIRAREQIKLVFLLIDIRRVPGDYEREIIMLCTERRIPVAIIATKCDKLSNNVLKNNSRDIAEALEIDTDSIFFTSAKSRMGKDDIFSLIEDYR
ncbi:MAG TPA: ribosome biogenesis GTP-binding protein YihA/YsxC [Spirochaetota bacterium]|nr:ribosome biogenesis GTP-binding protein YihA/YsxC [Spirochaetota bacterium]HPJ38535.1 ribosome biogenesis GTP-binding protein YihA/YsxC [Spirochaetota bacterium]HPQ52291.1 ribosome biogenesis GTP-binding protein YihA/YsxC [Spirochaetota bacterium]